MEFDSNVPIYLQISDYFRKHIASGKLKPGEQVPPVRQVAMELEVNPNTVQRAFSKLEEEGVMESRRTAGRYVTDNSELIHFLRRELAKEKIRNFVHEMKDLGLSTRQVEEILEMIWEEEIK